MSETQQRERAREREGGERERNTVRREKREMGVNTETQGERERERAEKQQQAAPEDQITAHNLITKTPNGVATSVNYLWLKQYEVVSVSHGNKDVWVINDSKLWL